ncbi:MAG: kynureninase, partial [Pseudomonadota bacterium]
MHFENNRDFAERMDAEDALAGFRQHFHFPTWRENWSPVYLCGNSLGLQSDLARQYVEQELDNWSQY